MKNNHKNLLTTLAAGLLLTSCSKQITLDELERLLKPEKEQQPVHFTISPEDYAEYQELKKLKETIKKILSKTNTPDLK